MSISIRNERLHRAVRIPAILSVPTTTSERHSHRWVWLAVTGEATSGAQRATRASR